MNKYIAEFIGTFFLVLTIGCTGLGAGSGVIAPLAIGAALMVMAFAGGHISGAHYNPAVTLAVLIRGRIDITNAIAYWIAQIAGAIVAWALAKFIFNVEGMGISAIKSVSEGLGAEILGTFALAYVVLNVATAKANINNSFYGLAIGFTVMAFAFTFGVFSGAAFNPAVAIGASLLKGFAWSDIWIYLLGNFTGASLAAIVFN